MTREELVERIVLDKICDDYENIDQVILRDAIADGLECGFTIERSDVVKALASLIAKDLAKAYFLLESDSCLDGMPQVDAIEHNFRTYFWATTKGIEFQVSDYSWWPFET